MDKAEKVGGAGTFLEDVKRLAPEYDEIVETIIALLKIESPREVLDIGSGVGNVDMLILENTPVSRIDCIEISPEMAHASVSSLSKHLDKARIINKDVMDFEPEGRYDAIVSNLLLHHMKPEEMERLLVKINAWLKPGGMFIWGDMMRREEAKKWPKGQKKIPSLRMRFAFRKKTGGKMEKETEKVSVNEYLLTEYQTIEIANRAGFSDIRTAWKRGSFAVFKLRK